MTAVALYEGFTKVTCPVSLPTGLLESIPRRIRAKISGLAAQKRPRQTIRSRFDE